MPSFFDIALGAGLAYLDVLRGQTFERVQRENLSVTRSNLDLARVRVTLGAAGRAEVLRWESQVAAGRRSVIAANSARNVAEIALNRLLHRPLEEPFGTEDAGLADLPVVSGDESILPHMENPDAFDVFRDFMVEEALAQAPELRQLDAALAAQRRALGSARAVYFVPTVAVQGGLTNIFTEGGAGAEFTPSFPPGVPDLSDAFPQANDLSWNLALSVSLPLFAGGARPAVAAEASATLRQLELQRQAAAERVEQRVRVALHRAGASRASIALAQDGARAARQSLELVTDAYARGAASLVDLLDAQNAAVVADLAAASATYDFLADMLQVERATGRFQLFAEADQRAAFFRRLREYVAASGAAPVGR